MGGCLCKRKWASSVHTLVVCGRCSEGQPLVAGKIIADPNKSFRCALCGRRVNHKDALRIATFA